MEVNFAVAAVSPAVNTLNGQGWRQDSSHPAGGLATGQPVSAGRRWVACSDPGRPARPGS